MSKQHDQHSPLDAQADGERETRRRFVLGTLGAVSYTHLRAHET